MTREKEDREAAEKWALAMRNRVHGWDLTMEQFQTILDDPNSYLDRGRVEGFLAGIAHGRATERERIKALLRDACFDGKTYTKRLTFLDLIEVFKPRPDEFLAKESLEKEEITNG